MNVEVVENLIERRSECNRDLFKMFYLRYITQELRLIGWKGVLHDGTLFRALHPKAGDQLGVVTKVKEVLAGRYHSLNAEDFNQLVIFKEVMLFFQG